MENLFRTFAVTAAILVSASVNAVETKTIASCFDGMREKLFKEAGLGHLQTRDPKDPNAFFIVTPKNILHVKCDFTGQTTKPAPQQIQTSPAIPGEKKSAMIADTPQFSVSVATTGLSEPLILGCSRELDSSGKVSRETWVYDVAPSSVDSPVAKTVEVDNTSPTKALAIKMLQGWVDGQSPVKAGEGISKATYETCKSIGQLKDLDRLYKVNTASIQPPDAPASPGASDKP